MEIPVDARGPVGSVEEGPPLGRVVVVQEGGGGRQPTGRHLKVIRNMYRLSTKRDPRSILTSFCDLFSFEKDNKFRT